MRCTECGSEMRFTSEPMKERYKGEEFTVTGIERWVCDECGNDVMKADPAVFAKFFHTMLEEGVYLAPSIFEAGFVSAAHSDEDIEATIAAARKAFAAL